MYNYGSYTPQYGIYNNPYNQNNIQQMQQIRDQWDEKIQLAQQQQQQQSQMQQQPQIAPAQPITQNFQLAPQNNNSSELEGRYAENIDEVKNTFVMKTGIFATKDYSTIWIKDVSGNIKTYKTEEIIPRDEKDMQIKALQEELNNMKSLVAQAMQQTTPPTEEVPSKSRATKK